MAEYSDPEFFFSSMLFGHSSKLGWEILIVAQANLDSSSQVQLDRLEYIFLKNLALFLSSRIIVLITIRLPFLGRENYNIIVLPLKAHRYPKEMLF